MKKIKLTQGKVALVDDEVNGKDIAKHFPFTPEGEVMAAKFYNEQAKIHFGHFANINQIPR